MAYHAKKNTKKKERTLFIDLPVKTQKTIGWICVAVILVIFACVILKQYDLLPRFNGRLRYYNEELYGVEDGVLYVNKSSTSKAQVFAIAEYSDPEGFVSQTDSLYSTSKVSTVCFGKEVRRETEIDDGLNYVEVKAVKSTPEEMIESIWDYHTITNEDGTTIEPEQFEGESKNGLKYKAVFGKTDYLEDGGYYLRSMICYVKAGHGCSVLVMPSFKAASEDQLPDAQYMLDLAEEVMMGITIR